MSVRGGLITRVLCSVLCGCAVQETPLDQASPADAGVAQADAQTDATDAQTDAAMEAGPRCYIEPCACPDGYQSQKACTAGVFGACLCAAHQLPDAGTGDAADDAATPEDAGSSLWKACGAGEPACDADQMCISALCTFLCEAPGLPGPTAIPGAQARCTAAAGQCAQPSSGALEACLRL